MLDMNPREIALMAPMAVLMFVLGVAPNSFLQKTEPSTEFLLESIERKRLAVLANEAKAVEMALVYSEEGEGESDRSKRKSDPRKVIVEANGR